MPLYRLGDHRPELHQPCWVADNATLVGNVIVGRNASVWFNCVLRGDNDVIRIGAGSNVQDGSVLHTDPGLPLEIGAEVTVGHVAMLHGCRVGDGSLIGMKAVVLNRAVIGRECLIGANALIPEGRVVPDRSLVVGSPGKVIRELTDEDVARLRQSARHYVEHWQRYRSEFSPV
jgi:carbonic anhydrase/acetyltransferase-like protein (isoleucine patch superfamily)